MLRIHEIREAIDTKLDSLEKRAAALETQLIQGKEVAIDKLEIQKRQFAETLSRSMAEIERSADLADEAKKEIRIAYERLQVQLALGKAESRDALRDQKEKIREALRAFEDRIGEELDEAFHASVRTLISGAEALEARLEALELHFESETTEHLAKFDEFRQELIGKIHSFRDDLAEKKNMAGEKAAVFEKDLSAGLAQIRDAFRKLH